MSVNLTQEASGDSRGRRMKPLMLVSFGMLIITAPMVIHLLEASGYAGTLEDTQLGFDAEIIKSYFRVMSPDAMRTFIVGNLVDYLFMMAYGTFFYSSAQFLSRNYRKRSVPQRIGHAVAWIGIGSALCDAMENVFLLSMTANPSNFPSWLALAHSAFALAKFAFMGLVVGWLLIALIMTQIPLQSRITNKILQTGLSK